MTALCMIECANGYENNDNHTIRIFQYVAKRMI